jgi:hypothetical protein
MGSAVALYNDAVGEDLVAGRFPLSASRHVPTATLGTAIPLRLPPDQLDPPTSTAAAPQRQGRDASVVPGTSLMTPPPWSGSANRARTDTLTRAPDAGVAPVFAEVSRDDAVPGNDETFGSVGPSGSGAVILRGGGASPRPVCGGERVALRLADVGYLTAGEGGTAPVVVCPEPSAEWLVTGVAPGVAVPVGRPVGLFNTVQGDHLVCRPERGAPRLGWGSSGSSPPVNLPMPPQFCPPEGVPGDAELSGAVVPVREGDPEAGLLLLLNPADGRALGTHLMRRVPELAAGVASDRRVGVVACRWSSAGGPSVEPLPPTGARLWVQGRLVADPGVSVSPVRALAWALDPAGAPVTAVPGEQGWPQTGITWQVLVLPRTSPTSTLPAAIAHLQVAGGPVTCAFHLPLPGRDGEPGSSTTITPRAPSALLPGMTVALVPGPTTALVPGALPALGAGRSSPRRVLRMPLPPGQAGSAMAFGCTVRVHLPGTTLGA